jgi:restriction endonuclease Mrr
MAIPRYKDVDLALLLELVRADRAVRPNETYTLVSRHFPALTEADMAITRKDGRTKAYQNSVHWARDHLRVRGLLVDQTGMWRTNPRAPAALHDDLMRRGMAKGKIQEFIASAQPLSAVLGQGWASPVRSRQKESVSPIGATAPTGEPPPSETEIDEKELREDSRIGNSIENVRAALIQRLNAMDGYEFEQIVARVLDGAGLRNAQIVGRSGDEGVDILAELQSPFVVATVAVQVKRHGQKVGPKDVSYLRDRWSRRVDKLLFVTTSDYTVGAREVAEEPEKKVTLINGSQLVSIMFEHGLGVRQRPVVQFDLDEEFFSG